MFEEGKRLPTEAEIAEEFGVSRATVQFAMSRLAWEGWIERFPGRGTFASAREREPGLLSSHGLSEVSVPKEEFDAETVRKAFSILGKRDTLAVAFSPDIIDLGCENKSLEYYEDGTNLDSFYRLVSFGRLVASEDISKQLDIGTDSWIFRLERSKYVETRMVEIERHYFAPHVFPKFDTEDMEVLSANDLFVASRIGEDIDRVEVTMKTIRLPLNELSLRSVLSVNPDFIAKWYSEDEKIVVVTNWTVWGT